VDTEEAAPPESGEVQQAPAAAPPSMGALRVERTADGGVRIEAPAELAGTLAAMFELLGKQLAAIGAGKA